MMKVKSVTLWFLVICLPASGDIGLVHKSGAKAVLYEVDKGVMYQQCERLQKGKPLDRHCTKLAGKGPQGPWAYDFVRTNVFSQYMVHSEYNRADGLERATDDVERLTRQVEKLS